MTGKNRKEEWGYKKGRHRGVRRQKKEEGEWVRNGELLIRNRLEHTHTYCSDIMGQECCAEEPTTEQDGRGGGLASSPQPE